VTDQNTSNVNRSPVVTGDNSATAGQKSKRDNDNGSPKVTAIDAKQGNNSPAVPGKDADHADVFPGEEDAEAEQGNKSPVVTAKNAGQENKLPRVPVDNRPGTSTGIDKNISQNTGEDANRQLKSKFKADITKFTYSINTPDPEFNLNLSPLIKIGKAKKWSFGINAFAGVSAVNEGKFLNINKPQVQDVSYVPRFSAPAFAPSFTPSRLSPGLSYSVGATVKREINKRFSVSASVNYLQMNTRNKVGNQVYGSQVVNNGTRGYLSVVNYYTLDPDRSADYKNRYHFIDVPVSLHTRINRTQKLPVYWNVGATVSRLLISNSLHFDGTTGVYYKNDRLLNQTQAAVTTGFSFSFLNKTQRPLWVGPSARYNVSKILHKDISASKNFVSLGLDVKWFIW
jgi:hypothetical protein